MHDCLADATEHCADLHPHTGDAKLPRRTLLWAGAGASAVTLLPALPAAAAPADADRAPRWRPDHDSVRFTLAVMPDTQYLFDQDRGDPAPLDASLRWILDHSRDENIVFLAHLGDLTQNGQPDEFARIGRSFQLLDRAGADYSVLAGNHDIRSSTNDQRGDTPYLQAFGPQRFRGSGSFGGASPDGYNTYHVFRAAGRQWLVLALDWRPSAGGIAWAQSVLDRHPRVPVILTTHELAFADEQGEAHLSDFGRQLWDQLVSRNDQIFLTLNGHFWPPGRTVLKNAAGHDVHVHITNYQDRYYGGSAMIRLYRFDLARQVIDVSTFSPYFTGIPEDRRTELQRLEVELTSAANRFSVPLNVPDPTPAPPPRPARSVLVPGTLAYWRFDNGPVDAPVTTVPDLSGHGNDLTRVTVGGGPDVLTWSAEHHRDQPAHASLHFLGAKNPARGAYLRTADHAPLNALAFEHGYTVEAFLKLPTDFGDDHAWCGLLTRMGTGGEAGKTGDDPQEPAGTLNLDGGGALQWAVWPPRDNRISTNWSHLLPLGQWWHLAVVNDGQHTIMYVDGCPVVGNPSTPAVGVATVGQFWLLGAYHYGRVVEQTFYGWLGDVRIVGRALPVRDFMFRH
jgi:3',5'-cyclic AMP phosphodiesterase CpdA